MRRQMWTLAAVLGLVAAGCGGDYDGEPTVGPWPDQPTGRLVVLSASDRGSMVLIDLESGNRRVLTDRPGPDAAFTPDGRGLVYEAVTGDAPE